MNLDLKKVVLVYAFILFSSVITSARPNPKICRSKNGKFPKPGTRCRGYYECRNYVPTEKTCGKDEHFNANKKLCDWDELYPCLEKQKDKECLKENGLFPKLGTNCKQYYRCCNGKAKLETCPADTLFDPDKGACEWTDLYVCTETSKRKECPRRNGQFLKPNTNCRKYYNCSNGEPEEQQCKKNTLFNPSTEKCESSALYTCIEKPERKECPKRNGNFLKPGTNCRKYYECFNGEPEERKCSLDTLFNPTTENCETIEKYTCIEISEKDICKKRNGKFLKSGTNCKEYYKCSDGRHKTLKCERNMLFNPASEKCESPKIYICVESSTTTEKVSSTVSLFSTSTTPADEKWKTSTDPTISKSTTQKITSTTRITYSTDDPFTESTNSRNLETTTKFDTQPTLTDVQSTNSPIITRKTSTSQSISEIPSTNIISTSGQTTGKLTTLDSKISTPEPTTDIITTLNPKEISNSEPTLEIKTTLEPKEISTAPTTIEISTSKSMVPELSTSRPTTLEPKEISTAPTTIEISNSKSKVIEFSTSQPTTTEISQPVSTVFEFWTSQPTKVDISTSQASSSDISRATYPQISSTHSTDNTIFKENKEGDITDPTLFETTFSSSTWEETTSGELNILCPQPTGIFPHPTNKYKFIKCANNEAYVYDCPSNLVYKHNLKRCDYE